MKKLIIILFLFIAHKGFSQLQQEKIFSDTYLTSIPNNDTLFVATGDKNVSDVIQKHYSKYFKFEIMDLTRFGQSNEFEYIFSFTNDKLNVRELKTKLFKNVKL